ncbi:hypothetical protein Dsin_010743 [Dipteronia sinensis]|uniref:BAG domain-containing protein n=1 Tax=Dipteronia sinensis TaxID=43782 RepID=A0AAE0ECV2_9ROSI|nr:hypothetical protein Dsin_010743 [Dipteronia sinensis]
MDSPFYRAYKDLPSRPHARQAPTVKEIPVHFVASERREIRSGNRSESAVKIQRVFRGFLVRKSVKKITEIRAEVEEIERRISEKETIELIGRDSKVRLRVNETLMNLLFKLDSVRGVDSGVRDFRKAVIKRTIALQEILDSIAVNNNNNLDRTVVDDVVVDQTAVEEEKCTEEDGENHDSEEISPNCDTMPSSVSDCRPEESVEISQSGSSSVNPESLVEECEEDDDASSLKQEENVNKGDNVKESKEEEESMRRNNREVLFERMVEENEKMMGLMAQLFERNEVQTRLLSSLSQRVEQLERAFLCDRLRRRKKRQAAAAVGATVDACGFSPNVKKCGKR